MTGWGHGWLLVLMAVVVAHGCASAQQSKLQRTIRKAAETPVADKTGNVARLFQELATAGGLDPSTVYVGVQRSQSLNAAAVGNHHFLVTAGALQAASLDRCFIAGIIAHEIAHDILKHPESIARASDATTTASVVLGTAAGMFVPGAGYLVSGATTVGMKAYSRSQEAEADAMATRLLRDAGQAPWALRYSLEFLRDVSGDSQGVSWLRTHPLLPDRIAKQPPIAEDAIASCPDADTRARIVDTLKSRPSTSRPSATSNR